MTDVAPDPDQVKAAARAYIYGYPLVYDLRETASIPAGSSGLGVTAPLNTFGPARELLDPTAAFVTPNNDTLYLLAVCDLSAGPLVLDVPDTDGRYYVLQFVDAWSNNFAYVGRRATGTAAGSFLLTPVGFSGDAGDRPEIACPSSIITIVGRIQVDGVHELPAVHALQDGFRLSAAEDNDAVLAGVPRGAPAVDPALAWWEELRVALAAFPPPAADQEYLDLVGGLGLLTPEPLVDVEETRAAVLVAGRREGEAAVEQLSRTTLAIVDGWSTALHAFDYNLDRLGPGTIDSPAWKISDRDTAYVARAVAARLGLWGNHGYEADYHILWQDEHGEALDGSRCYELTLAPPPPVEAFWSLTMYDKPDYYLIDNPLGRYSIGDRTPGLQTAEDGSVTLYLQHESPGADKESNWLPAPAGGFRPILRSYQPGTELLEERYSFPKARRTA